MSLWALLGAPLLAGNDLSSMSSDTLSILTNRDGIAVDQDALGKQGERVWASKADEIWMKPLKGERLPWASSIEAESQVPSLCTSPTLDCVGLSQYGTYG
jgi:alpha-galactosidase